MNQQTEATTPIILCQGVRCMFGPHADRKSPGERTGAKDWGVPRSCNVEASAGFRRHRQPALPPPWSIAEYNEACFIVRDHSGQALAYTSAHRFQAVRPMPPK